LSLSQWQRLYFRPLPHGHGSFLDVLVLTGLVIFGCFVAYLTPDLILDFTPDLPPDWTPDLIPDLISNLISDLTHNLISDLIPNLIPDLIPSLIPDILNFIHIWVFI